jgi:hypothetical protein
MPQFDPRDARTTYAQGSQSLRPKSNLRRFLSALFPAKPKRLYCYQQASRLRRNRSHLVRKSTHPPTTKLPVNRPSVSEMTRVKAAMIDRPSIAQRRRFSHAWPGDSGSKSADRPMAR